MKNNIAVIASLISILCAQNAFSKDLCTLIVAAESGKVILQEGQECNKQVTPLQRLK
ncbi:UNVERIFIED_ORG: hypothetical protein J2806_004666 [Kosakonia oryzae]|uniref:Uncharacterized protein n=1 Tax=Kosakonia radicincitans TaxID=283686 RepID=A0AAX2EYQ1_9ENTR|nr:hypothetical protein [Kosakonia oryzae]SFF34677.1 hypothetical protein SAMN03159468_04795 [Kosakonia radicincitans]SFR25500.1 hypothetical protein SAMN03159514_04675 [Kosakonia radicincitans]SFU14192.1 hypothetical protein SAMN03159428_04615 [Kosakonia radicincitans]SFY22433.1 hypothetical protein SAMN03159436_04336 [Kosakonia radicincitans]